MAISEANHVILVLLSILVVTAAAIFHGLSWFDEGLELDIFSSKEGDIWRRYELTFIERDWIFYLWMTSYGLQLIWLIYSLIAPCYPTKSGSFGLSPAVLPLTQYILFLLCIAGCCGWLVLWNIYHDDYARYAIICLSLTTVCASIAISLSVTVLRLYWKRLADQGFIWRLSWIKLTVHNGLGFLAAWPLIVILLNLSAILTKHELVTQDEACYISMGILLGYVIILVTLDILVAKRMLSTMFTPYCLAVIFYVMIIYHRGAEHIDTIFVVAAVSLTVSSVLLVVKVVVACSRELVCTMDDNESIISISKTKLAENIQYGAVSYENNSGANSPTASHAGEELAVGEEAWAY